MESIMSSVMYAASWTFLHSLWMGLVLALIVAAIIHFISVDKSGLRYRLSIFAMLLFLIANVGVFVSFLDFKSETNQETNEVIAIPIEQVINTDQSNVSNNFINIFSAWVDQNFQLIFAVWLIFFVFKIFKMYQGAVWLRKVRTTGTVINDLAVLERLKSRLKITKQITVIESMLIQVPAVSGIIKPILYLPLGFFNQLSIQDAEAVLLHELAHIKRYDYFVNILQSITETIYFFNLPLLWASNLIKEERENCCDDIALQIHQDKLSFVQAIIHFYEKTTPEKELSLSFNGDRMPTLQRVYRILNNKKIKFNSMDKMYIGACFLFTTFFGATSLYIKKDEIKSLINIENPFNESFFQAQQIELDEIKQSEILNESTTQTESLESQAINNFVSDTSGPVFKLNGKNIVELNTSKMVELNTKNMAELNTDNMAELNTNKMVGLNTKNMAQLNTNNMAELNTDNMAELYTNNMVELYTNNMAELNTKKMVEPSTSLFGFKSRYDPLPDSAKVKRTKELRKMEADSRKMEADSKKMEKESRKMEAESMRQEKEARKMEAESRKMEAELKKMVAPESTSLTGSRKTYSSRSNNESNNHQTIISFLNKENLIKEGRPFTLDLSKEALIIDGKKQSAELLHKLLSQLSEDFTRSSLQGTYKK